MTPKEYKQMMDYLTRSGIKDQVKFASDIAKPVDKFEVQQIKLFNEFNTRNPRTGKAGGGMLVQPGFGGTRQGYKEDRGKGEYKRDSLSKTEQKKIKNAFPDTKFDFDKYRYGVKKYPDIRNQNITSKDYTKVLRFIKKGYKLGKGEGLTTRGEKPKARGTKLSLQDQEKIKSLFKLPPGEEWDFKTYKYGIKQEGRENLLARMARRVSDKKPWKVAADFGSTEGWMILQMNRVFENETKAKVKPKDLTYQPVYKVINSRKRIIGFKDNTVAGGGKFYYGLNRHAKKNATNFINHGDFKLNQKLVDISKRSLNQPNEVITGLLKDKGFTGKVNLNQLINFLSGTEATSAELLKNAIVRHHNSGVAFGSATNDLSLTTQIINTKIRNAEANIRQGNILQEDIQLLKNNNIFVRGKDGKLYGSGAKTPIGQFKQIEKSVETALKEGVDFKGKKFSDTQLKNFLASFGDGTCAVQFGKGNKDGGRIGYQTGTANLSSCLESGAKNLNEGKFKTADQVQDAAKLLRGGRAVISGLMKYGIIPELAYVGLEAAGRTLLGEKPTNALLKSIDTLTFGATDFGSGIEAEKFGKFSDQKLAVDKFRNSQALVNSLQNKLKNLEDISNQGGEGYVGDLTSDIQMTQAQLQTAQNALQKNTVSSDLIQFIDRKGQEIADTEKAKSGFAKQSLKDQMEGIPGIKDYTDTETTRMFPKQPSQMDLNLNMFPKLPTDIMQLKTLDAIDLAQALRAEGQNVSAKDILAYRDELKQMPLSKQAEIYGDEQIYGTQGADVLQPLAGGGIAKLAGVDSGPPPEKGPMSQGLPGLLKRVKKG